MEQNQQIWITFQLSILSFFRILIQIVLKSAISNFQIILHWHKAWTQTCTLMIETITLQIPVSKSKVQSQDLVNPNLSQWRDRAHLKNQSQAAWIIRLILIGGLMISIQIWTPCLPPLQLTLMDAVVHILTKEVFMHLVDPTPLRTSLRVVGHHLLRCLAKTTMS